MSESTKRCGLVTLIIYASLFFLMSLILIGISVKVCEKVIIGFIERLNSHVFFSTINQFLQLSENKFHNL
jgi:hypothetical protein